MHDGGAAVLHRMAAGGISFIRALRRVGCYQADLRRLNVQLFSRHLDECRFDSLTEFGLAGEYGNVAGGIDADPGIQHRIVVEAARQLLLLCSFLSHWPGCGQQRKRDQQRTPGKEKIASRQRNTGFSRNVHRFTSAVARFTPLALNACAARRTARKIRM
jgi:hypothetical protein